ncbi:MAG: zf-HC2 domain-containing protein [Chloroflexi bacterium]|nr:zf-HC2 domain-containing protein [Chloroflexota bacterium]MDA1173834.1 zf-HC2 domain-containing protein [Chloroflexota bacterium]
MAKSLFGWFNRRQAKPEFDCDDLKENCSDYVDSEMVNEELAKFESHMNDCPDCSTFVKTFRATVMTARDLPSRISAQDLKKRIQERIASEGNR